MNVIRNALILATVLIAALVLGGGVAPDLAPIGPREVLEARIEAARRQHAASRDDTPADVAGAWAAGRRALDSVVGAARGWTTAVTRGGAGRSALAGGAVLGLIGILAVAVRRRRRRAHRAGPRAPRHDRATQAIRLLRIGEAPDAIVPRARLSRDAIELLRHTTIGTVPAGSRGPALS